MKNTVLVFLAPGFEEVEALAPIDILRRGEVDVKTVAVNNSLVVKGAHHVGIEADMLIEELDDNCAPLAIVLPGGMPGASNLYNSNKVVTLVKKQSTSGKLLAAICASPGVVLAQAGILEGKKATAYPSFEQYFPSSAEHKPESVVVDGNIITSQGPAYSLYFGLAILRALKGDATAKEVADGMLISC